MKALGVGCLWQLGHNSVGLGLLWIVEGVLKCLEGFFVGLLRETGAARQSLKSVPWIPSWNSCSGVTPKTPRGRPPTVWTSVWIILNLFHDLSWSFMIFHDLSWSFMIFHDLSWSFMIFHDLSWSFMIFHDLSWSFMIFHDLSWSFMIFHDLSWSFMIFHDLSWSFMIFHDLSWSFMIFHAFWCAVWNLLYLVVAMVSNVSVVVRKLQISRGRVVEHPSLFLELHAGNAIGLVEFGGWAQI